MARVLLSLFLALFPLGPVVAAGAAPKAGGTLQFGLFRDIVTLNPFYRTLSVNRDIGSIAFECLLTTDKNGEPKPSLATTWEVSRDGLQYSFRLRRDVKFHNRMDMTSEDVIWSIQYALDPKNSAHGREILLPIASVSASDPWTVRITLKEPYVPFLAGLTSFEAFPVVSKGSLKEAEKPLLHPPGTGPFMMTEYKSQQVVAFKKFDQYWQKGLPYLDGIRFKPVDDDSVRLTALRTGELDLAERIPFDQAMRIQKGEIKELGLMFADAAGYQFLVFNAGKPPFNNLKLRQAVAYAVDKGKIMEGISWGFGQVVDQRVPKNSRWTVPITDRKRDLEKAKALLKEAGYPNGIKVVGQVPKSQRNQDAMQLIQSQLREAGIQMELELMDLARHQNELRDGNISITSYGGNPSADPDLAYYKYFHTENGPRTVSNHTRYSNPRVDRLLEQGRQEMDFQKRYRIYKEVVEILQEEIPQITLGFTPTVFAFRHAVRGFDVHPTGQYFYGLGGISMAWLDR